MRSYEVKNKGTTSLFRNRFLEALTRTHFAIPVSLYFIISIALLIYAGGRPEIEFWKLSYMFPLGLLTFSFVEYAIHRWVFHFHAVTEKQLAFKYKVHGVHHEFPRDKDRLVMPPVLSVLIALIFYGFFFIAYGEICSIVFPGIP
jgi:hypothetical protein